MRTSGARASALFFLAAVLLAALVLRDASAAAPIVVDRTDDAVVQTCSAAANDCTLRGAITKANSTAGADVINFSIGTAGNIPTINITAALPNIGGGVDDQRHDVPRQLR